MPLGTGSGSTPPAGRAKRPRDRADRILAAATRLLCERGYHAVSLNDIGEAVGVTGPAIYRHFSSKEALLVAVIERGLQRYGTAYEEVDAIGGPPEARLRGLMARAVGPEIAELSFLSLTLSELKHLPPEMVRTINSKARETLKPWVDAVRELHPHLTERQARFLVAMNNGAGPTVLANQSQLPSQRVVEIITSMVMTAMLAGVPELEADVGDGPTDRPSWAADLVRSSGRERILEAAVPLFHLRGFSGVGIDEVGAAAGVTGPAIYKHFRNKEEILFAAFSRVTEQLSVSVGRAFRSSSTPEQALRGLVDAYVDLTIDDTHLMAVYWEERRSLPDDQRAVVQRAERGYVDDWLSVLSLVRPDLSTAEARVVVYCALEMMNGYWLGQVPIDPSEARQILATVVPTALLHVDVRSPAQAPLRGPTVDREVLGPRT